MIYIKLKQICILIVLVAVIGCDSILDTQPVNQLNNDLFWQSEEDAISAVNSIYSTLPHIGDEIALDNFSDIAHTTNPANFRQTIEQGAHDSSLDFFESLWNNHYQSIRRANYFLENADRILEYEPNFSIERLDRLKAEARVIRAMMYMRLSFLFGDVPLVTTTLTAEEGSTVEQTPSEIIVDFIDEEITTVATDLPLNYPNSEIGRITRGAALALKARAMIYNERWQEAADAANQVINLNIYSLYNSYETLFGYEAQNNNEVILDKQYTRDGVAYSFFNTHGPNGMNGNAGISVTRTLVDAFETNNGFPITEDPEYNEMNPYSNRDPRLGYTLFLPAFSDEVSGDIMYNGVEYDPRPGSQTADEVELDLGRTKTGFNTKKYVNEEDLNDRTNNGTNFILIRYADVLLMYAEAKIELNEIDESVYNAINEVRQRPDVDMPPVSNGKSQGEMREIVRHERLVELSMEGLRFWDIRRWRIAEDVMQGTIPGMRYIRSGGSEIQTYNFGGTTRSFNPNRDYFFPIPAQELVINTNLTQNPGY